MPDQDDNNLLSRWSKRKIAARETAVSEPAAIPAQPSSDSALAKDADTTAARDAELKANREAAEAVDLEKLDKDSDFSVFMKDGVPDLLRRQAMAILWRSNPVLANVDGLVDYGEDFGSPDLIMKTLKSAWQVGRGYAKAEESEKRDEAGLADERAPVKAHEVEDAEHVAASEAVTEDDAEMRLLTSEEEEPIALAEAPLAPEDIPQEAGAPPRVSLRRRLMLDSSGETNS